MVRILLLFVAICILSIFVCSADIIGVARKVSIKERAKQIVKSNKIAAALGEKAVRKLQKKILKNGCNVRVCFALDGSGAVSAKDYKIQKSVAQFVAFMVGTDTGADYSAVQYGVTSNIISPLTNDVSSFIKQVGKSKLVSSPSAFLGVGLGFCIRSVRGKKKGDGRKIVVIGDGGSNFGGPLDLVVGTIKKEDVLAVGVGFRKSSVALEPLLKAVKGKQNKLFLARNFKQVSNIVSDLTLAVCNA